MSSLKYNDAVQALLDALPEIKDSYDDLQADIGPDVMPYMIFGLVLKPFVNNVIKLNADSSLKRRIFSFLEEMAGSTDIEVVNLLYISLFETWFGEPEILNCAWKYMGVHMKAVAIDAARRLNQMHNLPHD